MSETSTAAPVPKRLPRPFDEIAGAAIFLTRLPIRWHGPMPADLHARSMAWYPLVGAALGLSTGLVHALALGLGLTPLPAALLAILALAALTGALHEDGLADVADGFGGGRDKAAKLAIMRDSRVGTYGVLALVFSVTLRAGALAVLAGPAAALAALIGAEALSRAIIPALNGYLDPARSDGLGAGLPRPDGPRIVVALVLGAALAGLALGAVALPAMAAAVVAGLAVAALANRQIGGFTGDVLGAAQQVAAILVLLTLAGLAP